MRRVLLTIRRPRLDPTGDAHDEREQRWSDAGTISVWMKQRQGGERITPAGMLRAHMWTVRFTAPRRLTDLPQEGWRLQAEDGTEYAIRDAIYTGRTARMTVERV